MALLKTIVIGLMDAGYRVITHLHFARIRAQPMLRLSNFGHITTDYGVDCLRYSKLANVLKCAKICITQGKMHVTVMQMQAVVGYQFKQLPTCCKIFRAKNIEKKAMFQKRAFQAMATIKER